MPGRFKKSNSVPNICLVNYNAYDATVIRNLFEKASFRVI